MPSPCEKCGRARGGSAAPPLPPGQGTASLYAACPKFDTFHVQLGRAVSKPSDLLLLAQKLDIEESEVLTTGNEDVQRGWLRVMGLAAKRDKLAQLAKLASEGPGRSAYGVDELFRDASCGFVTFDVAGSIALSPTPTRSQSAYLLCDRKDEWEPFTVPRAGKSIVPLIALGPEQEALDLLLRRIERCLEGYEVIPVKWESDFPAANRYDALRLSLTRSVVSHAPAGAGVPELLKRTSPTVLLHPLLQLKRDSPESDSDGRYLKEYYARLADDLSHLSGDYPAPFVVQCIAWDNSELRDRAKQLASEISSLLSRVTPTPQVIQYALKPIENDDIETFLRNSGKSNLWPRVSRDIHRVNWPVPLGRKSSRAVYEALRNAFSNDGGPEKQS